MDRASGSGVFARDPDALLDLIELEPTEALMKQEENKAVCGTCKAYLDAHYKWEDDLSQDDLLQQCTRCWITAKTSWIYGSEARPGSAR